MCPEGYVLVMRVLDSLRPGDEAEVIMDSYECAAMVVYSLTHNRSIKLSVDRDGSLIRLRFMRLS